MLSRRSVLGLLTGLLVSCSSPNPTLYTLAVVPGSAHAGAPKLIELRSIALARYLERSQIVRSSEDFRLDVLSNEWWGEPLDAMLGRILVQELTDRLPGSTVFAENSAISTNADIIIGINVQRLDADRSGTIILIAQIAMSGRNASARSIRLSVPPTVAGTSGLVSAMSTAPGQLADAAAEMLAGR